MSRLSLSRRTSMAMAKLQQGHRLIGEAQKELRAIEKARRSARSERTAHEAGDGMVMESASLAGSQKLLRLSVRDYLLTLHDTNVSLGDDRFKFARARVVTAACLLARAWELPSTADAVQDDPTIRREVDYARRWGFDWYFKANLYAYRATNPDVLRTLTEPDAIGPENAEALRWVTQRAEVVICAWGSEPLTPAAEQVARRLMSLANARYLKRNQDGMPAHPLYLKKSLVPLTFASRDAAPAQEQK